MSEIIEKEATALTVIEPANVMTVFTDRQRIDPILEHIAREVRSFVPDTSTAKGRKEIASLAFKVAQTKTYLDGLGKDLVAELKELPGRIDKNRAAIRETLDALKAEARRPLTEWEAEQERIAAEEKAKAEAAALAVKVEADHELAILMDREIERQAAAAKAAAEQARIDREARIAAEAAERAKRE
ncbi:MAG: hypothetical protein KGH75_14640, partial [Rhodospirillales bacterium]|nr:hypothetical protein [Rhodospirillales bacterium]